ncbi:MAG: hypothetical protein EHM56_06275 [Chloroflexi bacterium]|nr:MAG: hypothetical protein EHM56_06275 [Chloroflexota bacterium]
METIIVLAMHGAPARDFPPADLAELMSLHGRLAGPRAAGGEERAALEARHAALDARARAWPRTAGNDPFWAASLELGEHLSRATGHPVIVGFNEFCAPSLDDALDQAVAQGAGQVKVVTPMMTRGGEHAELDIPAALEAAQERHPGVSFLYTWPFPVDAVARFLAERMATMGLSLP